MAIRWNAAAVAEKCDEAHKALAPALPIIAAAARMLAEIAALDHIPGYISQPVRNAETAVKNIAERAKGEIDKITSHIPKEEVAKSLYRGTATALGLADVRVPRQVEVPRFKEWTRRDQAPDTQTRLGLGM